jgi:hypothetical protein
MNFRNMCGHVDLAGIACLRLMHNMVLYYNNCTILWRETINENRSYIRKPNLIVIPFASLPVFSNVANVSAITM